MNIIKIIWHKIKFLKMKFSKKTKHLQIQKKYNKKWFGNSYGGFYVNPDNLTDKSIVYSFGIGEDISFDLEMIKKHKYHVWGFDPTPKSINWVKKNITENNFHFFEYGISDVNGETTFYLPKNENYVSGSMINQTNVHMEHSIQVRMKTLSDIMRELGHDHIDVLKMDIEGAEYNVIENILSSKIKINQILIEFHDRFVDGGYNNSRKTVASLNNVGYQIFGVSNSFEEVSFIKQDF